MRQILWGIFLLAESPLGQFDHVLVRHVVGPGTLEPEPQFMRELPHRVQFVPVVPVLVKQDLDFGMGSGPRDRLAELDHILLDGFNLAPRVRLAVDLLSESGKLDTKVIGSSRKHLVDIAKQVEVAAQLAPMPVGLHDADQLGQLGVQ